MSNETQRPGASLETSAVDGLFLRKATGVVRSWSPWDGFIYNVFAMNVVVMVSFTYYAATYLFPEANLALAIVIAGVICTFEAVAYAFLTTAMPRSGGDYVYQSRIFNGAVGTIFSFTAIVLAGALWMAIAGWLGATLVLGPFFALFGHLADSSAALDASVWLSSASGIFVIGLAVVVWAAYVNVRGLRWYAMLQRWAFIIGMACLIVMVAILAFSSQDSFVTRFDTFMVESFGVQNGYQAVLDAAAANGYNSDGSGTLLTATIAVIPLAAFSLIYPAWSVAQAGEIKRASDIKTVMIQMPAAEIFSFVVAAVLAGLLINRIGGEFLGAIGFLTVNVPDQSPLPLTPLFGFFIGVLAGGNWLVLALVALAFNAWFWMWFPNITLAASRVLLAMSVDRVLPMRFGQVNPRTHTPTFAIMAFSILSAGIAALYSFTDFGNLTFAVIVPNIASFGVTCLGAALFPFIKRRMYEESGLSGYRVAGIPIITIAGSLFFAFVAWLLFTVLTNDVYGVNSVGSLIFMGALYVFAALVYFGFKAARKRSGIDLDKVYSEIPVE